jgi:hypothetical protein
MFSRGEAALLGEKICGPAGASAARARLRPPAKRRKLTKPGRNNPQSNASAGGTTGTSANRERPLSQNYLHRRTSPQLHPGRVSPSGTAASEPARSASGS